MQIIITEEMVWLDDESNSVLEHLKSQMTSEQVENWLIDWFTNSIVPALMNVSEFKEETTLDQLDAAGNTFSWAAENKTKH